MSFYGNMSSTAARLLAKFGGDVVLRKYPQDPDYDPATATADTLYVDSTLKGAIFSYNEDQVVGSAGLIQSGDKQLLLQGNGFVTPELQDHVIFQEIEYVIKHIKEIGPAGTIVLYDIHLST